MALALEDTNFQARKRIAAAAEFLIYYTLLVILWGAWVRISHSGDGCGDSWPLCDGQLLPQAPEKKTLVELSHRLTSGLFGIYVLALFFLVRKHFPKAPPVSGAFASSTKGTSSKIQSRTWVTAVLILTVTEALLGAKLVLFGLVGQNDSFFRWIAMALHFVNSALLMASILLLNLSLQVEKVGGSFTHRQSSSPAPMHFPWLRAGVLFSIVILGVTGTIAALSTTLFPSTSLSQGMAQDFQDQSHFLLRWRLLHPMLGLILSAGLGVFFILYAASVSYGERTLRWRSYRVSGMFFLAGILGLITLFLLSPVLMKLVHLAMAHLLWMALVAWVHETKYRPELSSEGRSEQNLESPATTLPRPILFFDGVCHLCHWSVHLALKLDLCERLKFAPLQGPTAAYAVKNGWISEKDQSQPDSLILLQEIRAKEVDSEKEGTSGQGNTHTLRKSQAVFQVLKMGPIEARILGQLLSSLPRFISDGFYDFIARNRYKWFGRYESCKLPSASAGSTEAFKSRLLD